MNGDTVEVVT